MKYLFLIIFIFVTNVANSESTKDYLKKNSEFTGNAWYLNFHNNHGSKSITLKKVDVWFSECKIKSGNPDRIYSLKGKKIRPYSDGRILVTSRFPYNNKFCYVVYANFAKPYSQPRNITLKKPKDESWFKWWYLLAIPLFGLVAGFYDDYKKNTSRNKKSNINKASTSSEELTGDLFDDLLFGRYSLPLSYWIWFVLVNGVVSGIAFYFAEVKDNLFYLLPALLSNVVTSVGTWNSSTNYQLQKIKEKKTYGWGYAAKVSVIINALNMIGQSIVLINS